MIAEAPICGRLVGGRTDIGPARDPKKDAEIGRMTATHHLPVLNSSVLALIVASISEGSSKMFQ
jgi:hypothetical protein